jgi:hypothetical protein
MRPEFQFPDIEDNPNGFGGVFQQPVRLDSCILDQMRFPELEEILEVREFAEGFTDGKFAKYIGFVSRRDEQASMLLHSDSRIRILSAPLEGTGRAYRTILVRKRAYSTAIQAGLQYLRKEGFSESVDSALKISSGTFPPVAISVKVAYQLAPLINDNWELVSGYQRAVIEAAGTDVQFIDWSRQSDNPFRKIVIMSIHLPHMREVTSRASFEDASTLCANEPNI